MIITLLSVLRPVSVDQDHGLVCVVLKFVQMCHNLVCVVL